MATRSQLYNRLGLSNGIIGRLLEAAFEIEEEAIWKGDLFNAPHGDPWNVSFHASEFPGDNPKACGRKAMYGLMNIPSDKPVNMAGRMIMAAGKNLEEEIVWRFHRSGLLLSDPPNADHQMGFEDRENWLTGSPDAIINLPKKNRPHVIEIKGKDSTKIEDMKQGKISFDKLHRIQLLTYIGLTRKYQNHYWPQLDKCQDGTLLYVSRDRPATTHEFRFDYSEEFMEQGYAKLNSWKDDFIQEKLPERNKDWRWTEEPCKYCPVKRYCKMDVKDGVTKLSQSNAIDHAKEVYEQYDYKRTRQGVLDRWS